MTPHPIPPKLFPLPQICHSRKRAVKVLRSARRQMCSQGSRRGYWVRKNFPEATEERRKGRSSQRAEAGMARCTAQELTPLWGRGFAIPDQPDLVTVKI